MSTGRIIKSLAGTASSTGSSRASSSKYSGVVTGLVTNNQDPEGRGRVKVKFPWLSDDHESNWARVATPLAGNQWGMQFIPEVNDEVVVALNQGDIEQPVVLGMMYNGKDKPALTNEDGENNLRQIVTRSGHKLIFDDTDGSEKITLESKGGHKIVLDDSAKTIEITDSAGSQSVKLDANASTVGLACGGDTTIESTGDLTIKGMNVNIEASAAVKIQGSSEIAAKAAQVKLN